MPFIPENDRIWTVSNPDEVQRKAYQLIGHNAIIYRSDRLHKKYMILNPANQKWISFGDDRYEDFSYHHDKERRRQFRERNHKWRDHKPYSPSWLSWWLLW
jgi:hypothetical protein